MTLDWEKIAICYIIPGQVEVSCKGGMIKHGWTIANTQLCIVCEQKRAWQVNYYHQVQTCTNLLKHWFFSLNVYSPSFFVKSWESYFFAPRLFLNLTNTKSCRDVKSNSENGIQGHPIFSLSGSDFSFVSSCLCALSIAGKEWIIILPNQRNRGLNPHHDDPVN